MNSAIDINPLAFWTVVIAAAAVVVVAVIAVAAVLPDGRTTPNGGGILRYSSPLLVSLMRSPCRSVQGLLSRIRLGLNF